ncbi:hypothetical protein BDV26DRAFT_21368 [Aspergillus bertholletiae]|uniref:BZIP domain-containing protein n=1 Tax=Aspergillus bertholletiae TaxID=1226010 RepID=A0A5N7AZ72_9EURO|nr:hypothetical protein BDV26DRAFT_21368 [Aspergillus bertholletiae]
MASSRSQQHHSTPTKPWSTGRVLTSAQREAKRQKDRIAKREKAQRQKDLFDDLESKIRYLQDIIETHIGASGLSLDHLTSDRSSTGPSLMQSSDPPESFLGVNPAMENLKNPYISLNPASAFPATPSIISEPAGSLTPTLTVPFFLSEVRNCRIFELTDELLKEVSQLNKLEICTKEELNQDAVVRGVLEGWHSLQGERSFFCPLWSMLSKIDAQLFCQSGVLTRFSMLRMIHLMLLVEVVAVFALLPLLTSFQSNVRFNSYANLPPWYRPRPTQISFPHHVIADYFAWPGFRERLVVTNCEVLNDRFFKFFSSCFRLYWPYPISEAYTVDRVSRLYGLSEKFNKHIWDIGMWTMSKEFFDVFPELLEDMAVEKRPSGPRQVAESHY